MVALCNKYTFAEANQNINTSLLGTIVKKCVSAINYSFIYLFSFSLFKVDICADR